MAYLFSTSLSFVASCKEAKTAMNTGACCEASPWTPSSLGYEGIPTSCGFLKSSYTQNENCCSTGEGEFKLPVFSYTQMNEHIASYDTFSMNLETLQNHWDADAETTLFDLEGSPDPTRAGKYLLKAKAKIDDVVLKDEHEFVVREPLRDKKERDVKRTFMMAKPPDHFGFWMVNAFMGDEVVIPSRGGDWFDGGILLSLTYRQGLSNNFVVMNAMNQIFNGMQETFKISQGLDGAASFPTHLKVAARMNLAHLHASMLNMWGKGMIVDGTMPMGFKPMQTARQLFDHVESELMHLLGLVDITSSHIDISNSLLPEFRSHEKYLPSRFAALAELASLYMNAPSHFASASQSDKTMWYRKALWCSETIIRSGHFKLSDASVTVPNMAKRSAFWNDPDTLSGWDALFAPNNNENPEMIWAYDFGSKDGYTAVNGTAAGNNNEGEYNGQNFYDMSGFYTPSSYNNTGSCASKGGCNGYSAEPSLFRLFEGDTRQSRTWMFGLQKTYWGEDVIDQAAKPFPDSRYFIKPVTATKLEYEPYFKEIYPNAHRHAGARIDKWKNYLGAQGGRSDYPIFRYAEILMIRAEATARLHNDWSHDQTLEDVNALRKRSHMGEYTTLSQQQFEDEYSREFALEMKRMNLLRRMGTLGKARGFRKTEMPTFKYTPIHMFMQGMAGANYPDSHPLTYDATFPIKEWEQHPVEVDFESPDAAPPPPPAQTSDGEWNSLTEQQKIDAWKFARFTARDMYRYKWTRTIVMDDIKISSGEYNSKVIITALMRKGLDLPVEGSYLTPLQATAIAQGTALTTQTNSRYWTGKTNGFPTRRLPRKEYREWVALTSEQKQTLAAAEYHVSDQDAYVFTESGLDAVASKITHPLYLHSFLTPQMMLDLISDMATTTITSLMDGGIIIASFGTKYFSEDERVAPIKELKATRVHSGEWYGFLTEEEADYISRNGFGEDMQGLVQINSFNNFLYSGVLTIDEVPTDSSEVFLLTPWLYFVHLRSGGMKISTQHQNPNPQFTCIVGYNFDGKKCVPE